LCGDTIVRLDSRCRAEGQELSLVNVTDPALDTEDFNNDGRPDLRIHVTATRVRVPPEYCDSYDPGSERFFALVKRLSVTVHFTNTGKTLKTTPDGARAKARIEKFQACKR